MSRMWFWGESSRGVFGPEASLTPVSWTVPHDVVKVVCGEQHVLLLREDGTLLSHGSNSRRQLGRRASNNEKAGNVEGLPFVVGVACGQYHSLAVSLAGIVYSWGENEDGQLGVLPDPTCDYQHAIPVQLPTKTVQVACGDFHSVALTKGGDVLSWGSNSHGQLGVGRQVSLQYLPLLLYPLNGVPVTQISAGASHTLFLTLSGLVYCCGANNHGQLGLNRVDPNGRFNICIVPALRRLSIAFIACGENHSAVLTKEGELYTFGEGADGQLGHGSFTDEVMPKLVVGLDERASQVVCGRRHTLVLGSSGKLWAFGNGVKGQLGTGKAESSATPTLVQLPSSSDCTDLRIAAGWNSSFASAGPRGLEQKQITGRLDEAKLRKWLALKKCTPEAEREISEMFLSNSSLVASFTKVTGLSREAGALNIDLDAASRTFSQMLAVPWLRKKLDLKNCMEILVKSGPNLRSPEIIVVLLACPLFQEVAHVLNLVLPMAVVIKDMCEKCHTTLKGWWSAMSAATLLTHILLFKNALAFAIKSDLLESHAPGVEGVLAVLKLLYKVNKRVKPHKVPLDTFYVEEIDESHLMVDILFWLSLHHREVAYCFSEDRRSRRPIFCQYPFLLSLHSKTMAFVLIAGALQRIHSGLPPVLDFFQLQGPKPPVLKLSLRPSHLLEDTFRQLSTVDHGNFRKALVVQFEDDKKVTIVNKYDFFLHVFDELMDPLSNLVVYNEGHTLAWFPAKPEATEKTYFLFGVLCGMALYNCNVVHLPFPLVFFKKLLGVKATLDDLKEFEPTAGESLRCILDYSADVLKDMDTTFTVTWAGDKVELDPENTEKLVTASNKYHFVAAFVDHVFNKSVEGVFKMFKQGFLKVCAAEVLDFFLPEELQAVMVGNEEYDWELFEQNTVYSGEYHAQHRNILTFWQVFHKLRQEEKKKFLLFLTGSTRVPVMGMASIRMTVAILPNSTDLHYPEALTCHYTLLLPLYPRYPMGRQMHNRLVQAINHSRGFSKTYTHQAE